MTLSVGRTGELVLLNRRPEDERAWKDSTVVGVVKSGHDWNQRFRHLKAMFYELYSQLFPVGGWSVTLTLNGNE